MSPKGWWFEPTRGRYFILICGTVKELPVPSTVIYCSSKHKIWFKSYEMTKLNKRCATLWKTLEFYLKIITTFLEMSIFINVQISDSFGFCTIMLTGYISTHLTGPFSFQVFLNDKKVPFRPELQFNGRKFRRDNFPKSDDLWKN